MKSVTVKVGDHQLTGKILKVKDSLWVHLNGETFLYKPEVKSSKQKGHHGISSNAVVAPMPGKIIKINITVGSQVADGQVVIVMEAMKMEYTLKTNRAGVVKTIQCQVGDQVVLGQTLLKVE